MDREKLFLEHIEKYLDYKSQVNEIFVVNDRVFVIKNEDHIYNYTKLHKIIDEIKTIMLMFGYSEIYKCEYIGENRSKLPSCVFYSSGSTYSYDIIRYV